MPKITIISNNNVWLFFNGLCNICSPFQNKRSLIKGIHPVCGWIRSTKAATVKSQHPSTCKYDLIGKGVFTDIIKQDEVIKVRPNPIKPMSLLIEGNVDTDPWRMTRSQSHRSELCSYKPRNAKDCGEHQKAKRKTYNKFSPKLSRDHHATNTLIKTSILQNCERIHLYYF